MKNKREVLKILIISSIITSSFSWEEWKVNLAIALSKNYFHQYRMIFLVRMNEALPLTKVVKLTTTCGISSTIITLDQLKDEKIHETSENQRSIIVVMSDTTLIEQATIPLHVSDKWLVFYDKKPLDLNILHIPFHYKFIVVHEYNKIQILQEYYTIIKGGNTLSKTLGYWTITDGIHLKYGSYIKRRSNFEGTELRYLITEFAPCSSISKDSWNIFLCIQLTIWNTVIEHLNATAKPILSTNREPEYLEKQFNIGETQASINGYGITSYGMDHVKYMWPTWFTQMDGLVSYQGMAIGWSHFLQPFSENVWKVVCGWVAVCSTCIWIFDTLMGYLAKQTKNIYNGRREQIWTPLFAFLAQGSSEPTTSIREKVVVIAAFAVPAVFVPAYSAALTSILAIQLQIMPITDLSQLPEHPEYSISSVPRINLPEMFPKNDSLSLYLKHKAILPKKLQPENEYKGAIKMCKEKYVFVTPEAVLRALPTPCDFYRFKKPVDKFFQSSTQPKNSTLKPAFDFIIRSLAYSGVIETLKGKVTATRLKSKEDQNQQNIESVAIEDVTALFAFLSLVIILSWIILICECTVSQIYKRKPPTLNPYIP